MDPQSAKEARAFAVAKLKRAASLPRMQNGRRPPMHNDAVSEGERAQSATPSEGHTEEVEHVASEQPPSQPSPALSPQPAGNTEAADLAEGEQEILMDEDPTITSAEPTPKAAKRRSRSRTRARKGRGTPSPAPHLAAGDESSPDEASVPRDIHGGSLTSSFSRPTPTPPPVLSPVPSRLGIPPGLPSMISTFTPPPSAFPGSVPATPITPSLQDIQRGLGLNRSNSAAARMMAMSKLTGEPVDLTMLSPPSPMPTLSRSNTVSGGERSAARRNLLRRLGERVKDTGGDQTSGGEELAASLPSPSSKRRRRRSKRASASAASGAVDESDMTSTTQPNTPIVPHDQLPPTPTPYDALPDIPRSAAPTPSLGDGIDRALSPRAPSSGHQSPSLEQSSRKRRSVVVEDEDDGPLEVFRISSSPAPHDASNIALPTLPVMSPRLEEGGGMHTPPFTGGKAFRAVDGSLGEQVPFFLSVAGRTPSARSEFPHSPFGSPLREKQPKDEDEEQVLYGAEARRDNDIWHDGNDREISWVAEGVPTSRIPIHDDVEDEEQQVPQANDENQPPAPAPGQIQDDDDDVPRDSAELRNFVDRSSGPLSETGRTSSQVSARPSFPQKMSNEDSTSTYYQIRTSVSSGMRRSRSPSKIEFPEMEDNRASRPETPSKRGASDMWSKVKSAFVRSPSSNGRRSRTNSVVSQRRDHTDSSASRESGASLTRISPSRPDMGGGTQQPSSQPSPAASVAMINLVPSSASPSPMPLASAATLQKYSSDKFHPFPGMKKLEEERNRSRANLASASSPDIVAGVQGGDVIGLAWSSSGSGTGTTPGASPEIARERKLSHQASDSHLLTKYHNLAPAMESAPSSSSRLEYFNVTPITPPSATAPGTPRAPLPTNLEGARNWLSKHKIFSSQSYSPSSPISPPANDGKTPSAKKKPSLSDLLRGRKEADLLSDDEKVDRTRTPTSANPGVHYNGTPKPSPPKLVQADADKTPKARKPEVEKARALPPIPTYAESSSPPFPSPSEHNISSATPDPRSSEEEYARYSTSGSSSSTSSGMFGSNSQGAVVLERLDNMLGRGSRSPMWASAIDEPPRKLLLSSPILQVVNSNTVKDRFLFLFTDMLVIAKPVAQNRDSLLDLTKPNPSDRKYTVKNLVLLSKLRFCADRDPPHPKLVNVNRHPNIRTFVRQFVNDPDLAVSTLLEKTRCRDDPVALGQLLFKTLDIDRLRLGEYLARRTSRNVLKTYIDSFGFKGMRIDKALRVFLLSINVPDPSPNHSAPLETLLDAFASRWYEANATIVAYSRDLAVRLVRAVVQLNDVLHGSISQEGGPTGYPRRDVTAREFVEAFRRYDGKVQVADDILTNIHASIWREQLVQARGPALDGVPDVPVTIKRGAPARLTYRIQSEPIVLRIPQPDSQFAIQLYGQDLACDPPVLTFAKSSEASFRVTGNALGQKTIVMARSGPNASLYSGLPLSNAVTVERAFMRNTFQMAFADHRGLKRRYMFSTDDPLLRHQWVVSIQRQMNFAGSSSSSSSSSSASVVPSFHRAAEAMAFKVLQGVLISADRDAVPTSAVDQALGRLATSQKNGEFPSRTNGHRSAPTLGHTRSKSRSEVYHRNGPGMMEPDHSRSGSESSVDASPSKSQDRVWLGSALQMECQQNSSIALVLSYLQVGAP